MIKFAIVCAIYSVGAATENSKICALTKIEPAEWGSFEEALLYDCEKTAMLLAQELSGCYHGYKTSVVAVSFFETSED